MDLLALQKATKTMHYHNDSLPGRGLVRTDIVNSTKDSAGHRLHRCDYNLYAGIDGIDAGTIKCVIGSH